ncbi:MAG TPA: heme-binding domain-containing protein [Aggregatilinea sp.]|uniref:heme-binding domain-containing protein n=1 Tax=Aggregatilinea sp. TaxID=2806333 RepID=UPI002CF82534|nr:heme-binding domain-containing protein [Aggregatilinea sp.]HML25020.1 heme-binding domain-containing protein [Aggregatilinea sp.]
MDSIKQNWKKIVGGVVLVLVAALLVIQIIPLSRDNPPVVSEPNWDSPQTRDLAASSCFDCHSNETVWPWYSKIAPSKLLLWRDVNEGRDTMNFSDWASHPQSAGEISEVIDSGEMPPFYYVMMHSEAKLSDTEKQQLIQGLQTTIAQTNGQVSESSDS